MDFCTKLRRYQARMFCLTWLCYFISYIARNPASISKPNLKARGVSEYFLGAVDTCNLIAYSIGQILAGKLGDSHGARLLLAFGQVGIALTTVAFGVVALCITDLGWLEGWLLLIWTLQGLFQASGTPGCMKGMTPWFPVAARGSIMGIWNTSYMVGDVAGMALATVVRQEINYQCTYIIAGTCAAGMAVLLWAFMVDHPATVGLAGHVQDHNTPQVRADYYMQSPLTLKESHAKHEGKEGQLQAPLMLSTRRRQPLSMWHALCLPGVLNLGVACFMVELVRYALRLWLPEYLNSTLHDEKQADWLSVSLSSGGIVGVFVSGFMADAWGKTSRILVAAGFACCTAVALVAYVNLQHLGTGVMAAMMALVGFFIAGPDSLLTGTIAMDLGGEYDAAKLTGIINGLGHLGAASQGLIVPLLVHTVCGGQWDVLLHLFAGLMLLATACCMPVAINISRATQQSKQRRLNQCET